VKNIQNIATNLSGKVRHDQMEGREFLVAPMVMIVEGVLNGSEGPLLYPEEEMNKFPGVWDHKPVVVYHPVINGRGVSACDPVILTNHKVGVIMNTRFEKGKKEKKGRLVAEAWLEKSRIEAVDERVAEAIENNAMMELSTGLFVDSDDTEGDFDGKHYDQVARNFRPDHLALLPDKIGACSIEDGAGFLRNEMSVESLKEELAKAARNMRGVDDDDGFSLWVIDIFDKNFIFEEKSKLYRVDYNVEGDQVQLSGVPVEVVRRFEYVVANAADSSRKFIDRTFYEENSTMNKKAIVNALIAEGKWTEDDREFLMAQNEDGLKHLQERKVVEPEDKSEDSQDDKDKKKKDIKTNDKKKDETVVNDDDRKKDDKKKVETPPKPLSLNEYIDAMPVEMQESVRHGMETHEAVRTQLIDKIIAFERNTLTQEELETKSLKDLQAFAALCVNDDDEEPAIDYAGLAKVTANTEEPLEMPTMDFSKTR